MIEIVAPERKSMQAFTASKTPADISDFWQTPGPIADNARTLYGRKRLIAGRAVSSFDLDAAANEANKLAELWLGPGSPIAEDALLVNWQLVRGEICYVWCNPPYSRGNIPAFIEKAHAEARAGRAQTTLLVPASTEVHWWHKFVWNEEYRCFRPGVVIDFLKPRVRFIRPDGKQAGSPPIGSVFVTFLANEAA